MWPDDLMFGPLSGHMMQHIVLMNAVAPLAALLLAHGPVPRGLWRTWPWATAAQILLLWGWHMPASLEATAASPLLMAAMHLSLFLAALWFWSAVVLLGSEGRWRAVLALGVSGKLFCLLGVLLLFAPRELFSGYYALCGPEWAGAAGVADQRMAGLVMLIACPLVYVASGAAITVRWFRDLGTRPAAL